MFLRWKKKAVTRKGGVGAACEHKKPTTRLVPQVLESYRHEGRSRHRHVWTGPSFRLCCMDHPQRRGDWWTDVLSTLRAKFGAALKTPQWQRIIAEMGKTIPALTPTERAIYEQGYLHRTFHRRRSGEDVDDYLRRIWARATFNWRTGKPRPGWTTFWFNAGASQPVDPHDVLGLSPGFTQDELKAAYRAAAKRTHPDLGGSDEKFRHVQEAYDILRGGG